MRTLRDLAVNDEVKAHRLGEQVGMVLLQVLKDALVGRLDIVGPGVVVHVHRLHAHQRAFVLYGLLSVSACTWNADHGLLPSPFEGMLLLPAVGPRQRSWLHASSAHCSRAPLHFPPYR